MRLEIRHACNALLTARNSPVSAVEDRLEGVYGSTVEVSVLDLPHLLQISSEIEF